MCHIPINTVAFLCQRSTIRLAMATPSMLESVLTQFLSYGDTVRVSSVMKRVTPYFLLLVAKASMTPRGGGGGTAAAGGGAVGLPGVRER